MIEALVSSKLRRTNDGGHGCTDCQYTSKHLNCVKIHIESKQVRFPHQSDQVSQRSQVSRVPLCMSKVKVP